jgi:7-keto-8-aminopelargonate synthetase-like enzyme
MYTIDTFPGRTISVNGKSYLYFGGTSYLGLQTDPEFKQIFINNIQKYGSNYSASRKANVQIAVFEKAEKKLAALVGSEACITLSSGYLAGQVVSKMMQSSVYAFFYASNTHIALSPDKKKSYDSFEKLKDALNAHIKGQNKTIPVVFFDSMESLENGYSHFKDLELLPLDKLILVVDDSHGIGVMGNNGGGAYEAIKALNPKELIVCASLGKGFGIQVGAIFGNQERIEQLATTEFFGGGSPPTPAALGSFLDAAEIFTNSREKLKENLTTFIGNLKNPDVLTSVEGHPAFSFSNIDLIPFLKSNGILITNFNYPNDEGPLVKRIVLSAHHTRADINHLAEVLNSFS